MFFAFTLAFTACLLGALPSATADDCPVNHMCFVLDQSDSMVGRNYTLVQSFATRVAREVASHGQSSTFSAFGYSDFAVRVATPSGLNDFVVAVNKATSVGGATNMYAGLNACLGDLADVRGRRVILLITDCEDNGTPKAITLTRDLRAAGVSVVSIGIGPTVVPSYMRRLSSRPGFFVPTDRASFVAKASLMADKTCMAAELDKDVCQAAYDACDFAFKGHSTVPRYDTPMASDRVFTDGVVSKMGPSRLGVLNSNDVTPVVVRKDGTTFPITKLGVTPTHFKPFFREGMHNSGIGHEAFTAMQKKALRYRCIRVYFTTYQTLSAKDPAVVTANVNVDMPKHKCVVFKTM